MSTLVTLESTAKKGRFYARRMQNFQYMVSWQGVHSDNILVNNKLYMTDTEKKRFLQHIQLTTEGAMC